MPRPRRARRVGYRKNFYFFKPAGIPMSELKSSILTVDEFEAIRLKDLQGMGQKESADKMSISQPTFHRLILSARKKIADAIVNGKGIKVEGGIYKMIKPKVVKSFGKSSGICVCSNPKCNYTESKRLGVPCSQLSCPKCKSILLRKN